MSTDAKPHTNTESSSKEIEPKFSIGRMLPGTQKLVKKALAHELGDLVIHRDGFLFLALMRSSAFEGQPLATAEAVLARAADKRPSMLEPVMHVPVNGVKVRQSGTKNPASRSKNVSLLFGSTDYSRGNGQHDFDALKAAASDVAPGLTLDTPSFISADIMSVKQAERPEAAEQMPALLDELRPVAPSVVIMSGLMVIEHTVQVR